MSMIDSIATPLPRRTFLERCGIVGGSSLVMSAMRSWELMAAQAGPRPVLSGRKRSSSAISYSALPRRRKASSMEVAVVTSKHGVGTSDSSRRSTFKTEQSGPTVSYRDLS